MCSVVLVVTRFPSLRADCQFWSCSSILQGLARSLLSDIQTAVEILSERPEKTSKADKPESTDKETTDKESPDKETTDVESIDKPPARAARSHWSALKCAAKLIKAARNSEMHMGVDATHRLTGRKTEAPC